MGTLKGVGRIYQQTFIETYRADLDQWLELYNEERTHQGRWHYGKTPTWIYIDSIPLAKEEMIAV